MYSAWRAQRFLSVDMIHFHVVAEGLNSRDILSTEIRVIPKTYCDDDVPSERIMFMYKLCTGCTSLCPTV